MILSPSAPNICGLLFIFNVGVFVKFAFLEMFKTSLKSGITISETDY